MSQHRVDLMLMDIDQVFEKSGGNKEKYNPSHCPRDGKWDKISTLDNADLNKGVIEIQTKQQPKGSTEIDEPSNYFFLLVSRFASHRPA